MRTKITFAEDGWDDYQYWATHDQRMFKKINNLIDDTRRNGYGGLGHPESLKGNRSGSWSKEIDKKNRLVFRLTDDTVEVAKCRGHYDDH